MIFKKIKGNLNKIKPPGRKRKILLTLFFGKSRLGNFQSSNLNLGNQEVNERVINDRELNSLEKNARQIILAKAEDNPIPQASSEIIRNIPRTAQEELVLELRGGFKPDGS